MNENATPKTKKKIYSIIKNDFNNPQNLEDKNLLVFENNLSFELNDFNNQKFKKIFLIVNKNENRSIKLSEKVLKFKFLLIEDQKRRLEEKSHNCEIIESNEIKNINEDIYALYPNVGEN